MASVPNRSSVGQFLRTRKLWIDLRQHFERPRFQPWMAALLRLFLTVASLLQRPSSTVVPRRFRRNLNIFESLNPGGRSQVQHNLRARFLGFRGSQVGWYLAI
uniref:(northern house mosquito) hypothetical protein n=1 Tax=Culex pipiens TaxID=7175 RepID=A0A8D8BES7_CULPI